MISQKIASFSFHCVSLIQYTQKQTQTSEYSTELAKWANTYAYIHVELFSIFTFLTLTINEG